MNTKKTIIKKWLAMFLWIGLGISTTFLLIAAIRKKDSQQCKSVEINIKDINNNFFVDTKDVLNTIITIVGKDPKGMPIGSFDLRKIENELEKDTWIRSAELYFDNNELLRVSITERQPVARVYTTSGESFYLDTSLARLPLSTKFSARVPVFTSFPSSQVILSKKDSALLKDIVIVSNAIQKDSFRMAMIDQIDIIEDHKFEMIPKIGNQIIAFGDVTDVDEKFNKLKLFYEEVLLKAGLNKYSVINLQYKSQIVAKKKDAQDIAANNARAVQIMQNIAFNAAKNALESNHEIIQDNDKNTVDSSMIEASIQREGDNDVEIVNETELSNRTIVADTAKKIIVAKPKNNSLPAKKMTGDDKDKKPIKPKVIEQKKQDKKTMKPNSIPKPSKTTKNDY